MNNCTKKIIDCGMLLSSNDLTLEEKKNNLKNIIFNHIEGNYADYDSSISIDLSMSEIIQGIEKDLTRISDYEYISDILNAVVLGMEIIQNNHIHLKNNRRVKNYIEPIFSYNGDECLISITVSANQFMYRSLSQISKYFDNKFMKNRNIRTLKI